MVRFDFDGYEFDLTKDLFVQLMSNLICSVYPLIENLYVSMLIGYPLVDDEFVSLLSRNLSMLEQVEWKTEETGLKSAIKELKNNLHELLIETNQATEWIALVLGLSTDDLKQLEYYGSLQEVDEGGLPTGNVSLPNWAKQEAYRAFLERCSSLMEALLAGIEVFLAKLEIYAEKNGIQYDRQNEQVLLKNIPKLRELIKGGGLKPAL